LAGGWFGTTRPACACSVTGSANASWTGLLVSTSGCSCDGTGGGWTCARTPRLSSTVIGTINAMIIPRIRSRFMAQISMA